MKAPSPEAAAYLALVEFIERDLGHLPAKAVAGATMRLSVGIAEQAWGADGHDRARQALANILAEEKPQ